MPTDPFVFGYIVAVLVLSGVAKGITGTGLPLIGVPLMTLVVPLPFVVALMSVSLLGSNLFQVVSSSRELPYALRHYWPLGTMIPLGTVFGSWLLASLDARMLEHAVGAAVVAFVFWMTFGKRSALPARTVWVLQPFTGIFAGILGGVAAVFAPPLLMLLLSTDESRDRFVAILAACYLVASVTLVVSLSRFGLMDSTMLLISALAMLPVLLGQAAGAWSRRLIPEPVFRYAVQLLLFASGLKMLVG